VKLVDNVIKADATLGVKVEPYDDTELRERVEALEQKPDKDTVYDDTALSARVTALENREDKDTVYDDTALSERVTALENKPNTAYDDTAIQSQLDAVIKTEDSSAPCTYSAGDFFVYDGKLYKASADFSAVTLTADNISTYAEAQAQTAINALNQSLKNQIDAANEKIDTNTNNIATNTSAINTLNNGLTVKDITSQLGAPSGMKVVEIGNILYINIAGTKVEDVRQWHIPKEYCSSLGNVRFSGIATQSTNDTGNAIGLPALLAYPGKDSASGNTSLMWVTVINTSWRWQVISSRYYIFASAVIPL